jgi:hypothetical protein
MVALLTANVLVFASLYLAIDSNYEPHGLCNLQADGTNMKYFTAFAISVQTSVGGGYTYVSLLVVILFMSLFLTRFKLSQY